MRRALSAVMLAAGLLALGAGCVEVRDVLVLDLEGLAPLENGFHYEGWAIIGGSPVSTGKFNISSTGAIVDLLGNPLPGNEFDTDRDLGGATDIVISIEPAGDIDDLPSATKVLAGPVAGGVADLTVGAFQALGHDFGAAEGNYILATPTTAPDTADELSGIWFLDLATGTPATGLILPPAPTGWKYEGWVVVNGQPVTSGKFTAPDQADDSAPYGGSGSGPDFPGEDFVQRAPPPLTFPLDLSGDGAVISIEPDPDDAAAPYALKPLIATIPDPADHHVTYAMANRSADLPDGMAEIR